MLVRSFTKLPSTILAGRVINHFCTGYAIFLCSLSTATYWNYVKSADLYRTFIPQSFWNTRCGCPRGRKFHLTQSRQRDGRWSGIVQTENTVRHTKKSSIFLLKIRDHFWAIFLLDSGPTLFSDFLIPKT